MLSIFIFFEEEILEYLHFALCLSKWDLSGFPGLHYILGIFVVLTGDQATSPSSHLIRDPNTKSRMKLYICKVNC